MANTNTLGRTYTWNNAFQYRVMKKIWPEVEFNSTFFQDGPNDGKKQGFLTPGVVIGCIRLTGRTSLNFGGGFQIAATHNHTTNHNRILTVSFPF